jgi:hypothetical protein
MIAMTGPVLNNLTVYVARDEFETVANFYRTLFESVLFQSDDIICFEAGPSRALCVHVEGELGRAAGQTEAIFWIDDPDAFRSVVESRGAAPRDIGVGLELTDPTGRPLRFITPPR